MKTKVSEFILEFLGNSIASELTLSGYFSEKDQSKLASINSIADSFYRDDHLAMSYLHKAIDLVSNKDVVLNAVSNTTEDGLFNPEGAKNRLKIYIYAMEWLKECL